MVIYIPSKFVPASSPKSTVAILIRACQKSTLALEGRAYVVESRLPLNPVDRAHWRGLSRLPGACVWGDLMNDEKREVYQASAVGFGLYLAFLIDNTPETEVASSSEWREWNQWRTLTLNAFGVDGQQIVNNVMDAARDFYINTDAL